MSYSKIIVIRRDNIGDLVCTTPLFAALRKQFPEARIDALVNSYNRPVLAANPDLDNVYSYTKAKHLPAGESAWGVYWQRLKMLHGLRKVGYDLAILANDGDVPRAAKLAGWIRPRHLAGFVKAGQGKRFAIDLPVDRVDGLPLHAAEVSLRLLDALRLPQPAEARLKVVADPAGAAEARQRLASCPWYDAAQPLVAIHISARKVPQRWPIANFADLLRQLHQRHACQFVLFWSPGDENNPQHPGDDQKAAALLVATTGLPLLAFPTGQLEPLIAGLSLCDSMICSDGGAMHLAAALGKPIVAMFGNSDATRWRPWGVPCEVLQKPSRDVGDISVAEVRNSWERLLGAAVTEGG